MLVGQDRAIEYLKLTGAKHFRIYQANNKKTPVFTYSDSGGNLVAQNMFTQWATLNSSPTATPVLYYMTVFPKGMPRSSAREEEENSSVKDTLATEFYLTNPNPFATPGQPAQTQQAVMGALPMETQDQMAVRIREEIEGEYEMEDLHEEIDNLKASQAEFMGNMNKLIGYAMPLLQGFVTGGAPSPIPRAPHLAGEPVAAPPVGSVPIGEVMRLQATMKILRKNDPHIVSHLEKLAQISENSPAIFAQLLSMLDADSIG